MHTAVKILIKTDQEEVGEREVVEEREGREAEKQETSGEERENIWKKINRGREKHAYRIELKSTKSGVTF